MSFATVCCGLGLGLGYDDGSARFRKQLMISLELAPSRSLALLRPFVNHREQNRSEAELELGLQPKWNGIKLNQMIKNINRV